MKGWTVDCIEKLWMFPREIRGLIEKAMAGETVHAEIIAEFSAPNLKPFEREVKRLRKRRLF